MPQIRPSSDLRNRYNEISEFCHKFDEPVYITKNGSGDLAVMSIETFENLAGKYELHALLEKGLDDMRNGRVSAAHDAIAEIRAEIRDGTI